MWVYYNTETEALSDISLIDSKLEIQEPDTSFAVTKHPTNQEWAIRYRQVFGSSLADVDYKNRVVEVANDPSENKTIFDIIGVKEIIPMMTMISDGWFEEVVE